ncbi:hypothetical protein JOD29_000493 [Lysinibacillus composti]|uniref:DUF4121 family protein n=1 Tax=Lysinibacillus composti TaxID=720633 RepID=A0A3N9UJM7_9BACI|nr:DUF4121 family protein [Lysinibacillus composti]MBM7607256.1 hypothetical protein [Lysinibacillus composti]RQW76167.1 DUF4121 family protein [Lysinibacillus composti]
MYAIEELKNLNAGYDSQHLLTNADTEKVNNLIDWIQNSRDNESPQIGDVVEYTNKYGNYYANAHIDRVTNDGQLYICESPYVPFIDTFGGKLTTSTSGGAWHYIPKNLRYVGKQRKKFCVWGHHGPCANGAVDFFAEVNVWEYTKGEHDFTTQTHDKFTLYVRDSEENGSSYKYLLSKDGCSHTAFHTKEEYEQWLSCFNGVETDGFFPNSKIVWTFKQFVIYIPIEDYLELRDAVVDKELNNGCTQECKRIVENKTVTTYFPYQQDRIVLN